MYSNPPQTQQNTQAYGNYGPTAGTISHQTARTTQHVGYAHTQMDQTTPYQHYQQNQAQMPSQPNHMNPSHISSIPTQQQQVIFCLIL